VLAGLRPGAIVLMHDIHPWTVKAMPQILRAIRLRGLRAVSVPELLALDPPAPNSRCPSAPGAD
jgi:peptidoglycan/xylan/chitin deacetylase (PgdA/CDA1 family)